MTIIMWGFEDLFLIAMSDQEFSVLGNSFGFLIVNSASNKMVMVDGCC